MVTVQPAPVAAGRTAGRRPLRVVLVLKTGHGAMWTLPHVAELRSRGHQVVVVLPPGGRLSAVLAQRGVPVVPSAFDFRFRRPLAALAGLLRLRRQLRALAPDVLHYHLYASALAVRLASVRLAVPRVHMVAGPLYLESAPIRAAERWLARLDTVTIGGCEFTVRRYRRLGRPPGVTPAIPYGVDTARFRPHAGDAGRRVRAEHGIPPDAFVAVMVALVYAPKAMVRLGPKVSGLGIKGRGIKGRGVKGHDVLLDAWRRFHRDHPDSRLLIVGGGYDAAGRRYRDRLVAGCPTGTDGVTWVDSAADVRPYYAAADVSVSPSRSDNHGAALEAGAMGVPSIVSDAGGLPETVDPRSGWVVPAGDPAALAAALGRAYAEWSGGALADRGRHATALVRDRFDSASTATAVADVIERAAGPCPADAGGRTGRPAAITLFSDARFGRDRHGRWAAIEAASGPRAWRRYLRAGNRLRLAVRADPRAGTGTATVGSAIGSAGVLPLPYYVGLRGLLRRLCPLAVAVWWAVRDAEVVVLRLPGVVGFVAAAACRLGGRRYAVEVVGDPAEVLGSGVLGRTGRLLRRPVAAYLRWVVRGAAASLFVTSRTLQRRYPPRPGTPTVCTANVVLDPGHLAPAARTHSWGAGRDAPPRIVTIGSQEQRYKGHDVLLRAIRLLLDDGLEVTATIVGDGRTHAELVELAAALGLAGRVDLPGQITDRDRLVELLDSAALFALPSRTEGLPRALVEAMARGLPAVGSDVGGVPELLDDSCLVPVGDHGALAGAMAALLTDPAAWERQSARNLAAARAFEVSLLDTGFSRWLAAVPAARRGRPAAVPPVPAWPCARWGNGRPNARSSAPAKGADR